jgi:hypothetical protein
MDQIAHRFRLAIHQYHRHRRCGIRSAAFHNQILVNKMCMMEEEFGSYIDSQGYKRCRFCGEIWGKQDKGDEE